MSQLLDLRINMELFNPLIVDFTKQCSRRMTDKNPKAEEAQIENPPAQEDQEEEIPQDVWDQFDDAMDKILKIPKKDQDIPNQQAG